jgi:hypothetical protein
MMLLISLLLSGCVEYDVGIHFDSPSRGEIVQHLQIGERLQSLSDATIRQQLALVEKQARSLGGRVKRLPDRTLAITIPFSSGADLENKFNQFFSPATEGQAGAIAGLPEIESHLSLHRSNLLLIERNRLQYDLDLRSLGVASASGDLLLSPTTLVNLEFRLQTPWGARSIRQAGNNPTARTVEQQLIWRLVPGEQNHLEAVFWMPNPIGIGTVMIVLLVILGRFLRYPQLANPEATLTPQAPSSTDPHATP